MFRELHERASRPQVFGDDYPTPDGTCIRDYVHVADIADAHVAAAARARRPVASPADVYNIGRGEGSSVLEVIDVIGEVTGLRRDARGRRPAPGRPGARSSPRSTGSARDLGFDRASYDLRDMVDERLGGLAAP